MGGAERPEEDMKMIARLVKGVLVLSMFAALVVAAPTVEASPYSRAQAVGKAKEYLRFEAFSRSGLIGQLKYEGFSSYDSAWGADHSGANWYHQAVKKARDYLRFEHFSASGLIGQLRYEGFTLPQARYGVHAVGL
jgi:hypothetical protein